MHPPRRRPGAVHISAPSFSTNARTSVYRKIAYVFLALTVAIITLVLWLTSVRAEIVVHVKKESVKLDGVVEVSRTPRAGQIPGRVVQGVFDKTQEFQVMGDGEDIATSTAVTTTPEQPPVTTPPATQEVIARGKVKIVNKYSKDQPLVRTTRLLTADGKLYRIDKTITVPSGGSVTVDVYADKSGADYAIGPTNFTIPGLYIDLQKHIYGVSETAFTAVPKGSTGSSAPVTPTPAPAAPTGKGKPVTFADIDRAKKQLTETVLKKAMDSLGADIANRESMEVVYVVKVVEEKNNVTVGQVTESFLSSVKLDVTAVYYAKEDMQGLVRSRMKERVPQGREFVPAENGGMTYALESSDPKAETASIRVSADAQYRLSPQSPLLQASIVAGKSKSEAESMLKAVDGVESVDITIKPQWLDTIPTLKDRIHLTVE
ncbi:MAG: hypothetical protein U0487_01365 [Patescibacteria group bacterium]